MSKLLYWRVATKVYNIAITTVVSSMTQKQKLVETFRTNPGSLKFKQIASMLRHFGFIMIQAKGSHVKFKHDKVSSDLVIPIHNGDCKEFYKKAALRKVTEIENI